MRNVMSILLSTCVLACGAQHEGSFKTTISAPQSLVQEPTEPDSSQALSLNDPGQAGPYAVASFSPNATNPGYRSALIYYPKQLDQTLRPAVTLTGGFTNTKEQMSWLANQLASHGFVVIAFTPTNAYSNNAQTWADGHKGAISTLEAENLRAASPLAGKIDTQRLGVIGYSYGGAGSILAANQLPNKVKAAIPICAYQPAAVTSKIPFMFLTGTADTVAAPSNILKVFDRLNFSEPKAFVKLNNLGHLDIINGGKYHQSQGRFITAWALVFLAKSEEYSTYLKGDLLQKQLADRSVFASANDYIYAE